MKPRLLDLFCGAGGCSVGYARAGFDVIGVDHEPHGDYPFAFHRADAIDMLGTVIDQQSRGEANFFLGHIDVIHASPPCQHYSTATGDRRSEHPDLIPVVRPLLREWGGLYVIENVEGARRVMEHPIKLCGSAFGLRARRHRYFETNLPTLVMEPGCQHERQGRPVGVYGDHPQNDHEYRRPDGTRRGAKATSIVDAQDALGIDWMTEWDDLTDAIPPVFTEFIGGHLMSHLESEAVA